MPYDNVISRTDAAALIPEEVSAEIFKTLPERSAALQLGRRLPNMSRHSNRMPVMDALASAHFVAGDTGLKQTSEVSWENVYITAEELAVIVPIPEAVLDDADYDIWGEVKPSLEEALGLAIDQAVFYGTNAPASWPSSLLVGATAAGHVISAAAYTDLYEAIMSATPAGVLGQLMLVETDGFMVSGHVAHLTMRGGLRGVRDANGQPIFTRSMQDKNRYELDGAPILFPRNGSVVAASSLLISGDWTQLVYSLRQDITYKVLDQAVIQDAAGQIVYNLAQQDMVALRAVMRLGWQLPNPLNRINPTDATRYPFAILQA